MSEKVIIDGVNVAECKDYDDGTCCNDDVLTLSCEKTICMYKQLKRLQTENELLKRLLNEKVKTLDKMTGIYSARLCKKYKQALEEIREIANLIVNDEDKPSCVNDDNCPLNDGDGLDNHCDLNCPYILGKHIQDKINEVLKEGK